MNVLHSKHPASEVEALARAMVMEVGDDPDQKIGNPQAPRWRAYEAYARLALLARDRVAAGAPLTLNLFQENADV